MIKKDETYNNIIAKIAIEHKITNEEATDIIETYYKTIGNLIESDNPFSIKMDFFGKIRTTLTKYNIKELISFGFLKKRYETNSTNITPSL